LLVTLAVVWLWYSIAMETNQYQTYQQQLDSNRMAISPIIINNR